MANNTTYITKRMNLTEACLIVATANRGRDLTPYEIKIVTCDNMKDAVITAPQIVFTTFEQVCHTTQSYPCVYFP
jgi:hypothetical protein